METIKTETPTGTGKYTQLSLIGEGGGAKVFKAFDPGLERYVALKLLAPRFSSGNAMREQFFREVKIQAGLNIPGIVRVFDCGESPDGLYYTMELVNGTCLEKYCWDNHLTLGKKLSLLAEVAGIIDKLHRKGLIHRDIKPRNVMVDEYGHVKLLDLGLVALLEDGMRLIDNFQISGSPAYMPPEALNGKKVNAVTTAADIYSLSVMAYELICAFLPYDVDFLSLRELSDVVNNETPHSMETPFREKIPARVEKIISNGLSINPAERPSAAEFAGVMSACAESKAGTLWRLTAVAGVSVISAGIIIHILSATEKEMEKVAPVNNVISVPETKPANITLPPVPVSKPVERKTFYRDSAPESLKSEWEEVKQELASDSSFKGMGALYYSLPEKCFVSFKSGNSTLRSIDSRFESSGSLFYKAGDELTVELRKKSWDKPVVIPWVPVVGNVDVLCPDNSISKLRKEK